MILQIGILVIIAIVIAVIAYKIKHISSSKKMESLKKWLLYAVVEAEKSLGSGTGEVKLRFVYDLAIKRFPILTKLLTFEEFNTLVDIALAELNVMLNTNDAVGSYIYKE